MSDYKLFNYLHKPKDLENNLDVSIVDLLTDRKKGCFIQYAGHSRGDIEQKLESNSSFRTKTFAVNYGPSGNQGFMYQVFMHSSDSVNSDFKGLIHRLDNAYDEKKFCICAENGFLFREIDKISENYYLVGNVNAAYDEFKQAGYVFTEEEYARPADRIERIAKILKANKIHRYDFEK